MTRDSTSGILLIDKPLGFTSFDVVACVRGAIHTRAVGHLGTLDPRATGLLVLFANGATKLIHHFVGLDKDYKGEMTLGATTPTDDSESEPVVVSVASPPDRNTVERMIQDRFVGDIKQVPPAFSAIKIKGCPAHRLARRGRSATLEPRPATVHSFCIDRYDYPLISFHCRVSSGTYIRSLARDLGAALGVGGYLSALRRTRVGQWQVDSAVGIKPLPPDGLIPIADAMRGLLPFVELNAVQAHRLTNGLFINEADALVICPGNDGVGPLIGLVDGAAAFILERRTDDAGNQLLKPSGRL